MFTIFVPSYYLCIFSHFSTNSFCQKNLLLIKSKGFWLCWKKEIKTKYTEMIGDRGDNWQSKVPMGWDQGHSFEPLVFEALGKGGREEMGVL